MRPVVFVMLVSAALVLVGVAWGLAIAWQYVAACVMP
jgi:hypothetical protein